MVQLSCELIVKVFYFKRIDYCINMILSNDIDLFELLNNPNPQIYKDLTEEFFNIEQQLKRQMDAGVEPSMMEAYRGLYLSAQTVGDVVKSMQDKE